MKIKSIEKRLEVFYYVETDISYYGSYRRSEDGRWEIKMDNVWKPIGVEKIEALLEQEFAEKINQ